jgi:energy-coupling factor transporter ATP-binding protein EcfA2
MKTKCYRILDVNLSLSSDSEIFLRNFETDFSLFAAAEEAAGLSLAISYTQKDGKGSLSINGISRLLGETPHDAALAYQVVTAEIMNTVCDFTVLHGGVVAREGRALAISGPPGAGKTTLVTALLAAGFEYHSDDFCPIAHATRLVHPFPRTMWRVAADVGNEATREAGVRPGKVPVRLDPAEVRIASEPCRLAGLIFLDPGREDEEWCVTRFQLAAPGEKILAQALASLPDVVVVERSGKIPNREIRYRRREGRAGDVAALFEALAPYVGNKYRVDFFTPDFSRPPRLTRLSPYEMAYLLLGELKTETGDLRGRPGNYFMKLAGLLAGVRCCRLSVGPLEQMRDLAVSVWEEDRLSFRNEYARDAQKEAIP